MKLDGDYPSLRVYPPRNGKKFDAESADIWREALRRFRGMARRFRGMARRFTLPRRAAQRRAPRGTDKAVPSKVR